MVDAQLSTGFIIGIFPRSGTNYLFNLLGRHPECLAGSFGEVALLRHSALLVAYAERVVATWAEPWVENGTVSVEGLLEKLGDGLARFLASGTAASTPLHNPLDAGLKKRVLLTKTPDVRGLHNLLRLFPRNSRAVLLVRDGRGVVESGVRSFGWTYEHAIQRWAAAADSILEAVGRHQSEDSPLLLVRYEDLVNHQSATLTRIFEFFGLDPRNYDFSAAQGIGVIGSSDLRERGGQLHWTEVDKPAGFDPLRRFEGWPVSRRIRFAWVAGKQMKALGYQLDIGAPTDWLSWVWHHTLDARWHFGQWVVAVVRPAAWRLLIMTKRRQRTPPRRS